MKLSRALSVSLLVSTAPSALNAQAIDLTGLWQDDTGGGAIYRVRQVGPRFFWIVDATSKGSYVNLAFGQISGNTMNGKWVDLPGSPTLGGGDLSLRIESNNRLVKVSSSTYYGAQAWTRLNATGGVVPGGPVPPPPPVGVASGGPIGWGDALAPELRGQNKKRVAYSCPANPNLLFVRGIYGTDIYTDDSGVCAAAVHAGLIGFASGGTVTIEVRPSQDSYAASKRNGVRSAAYGRWYGSFVVITGGGLVGLAQQRVSAPPPVSETAIWQFQTTYWSGTWTRRGTSDLYDSDINGPSGARVTIVERVTFEGSSVHAQRIQSTDGKLCTLDGTLHPDGRTYVGTAQCPGGPNGWVWRITPAGLPFPPW